MATDPDKRPKKEESPRPMAEYHKNKADEDRPGMGAVIAEKLPKKKALIIAVAAVVVAAVVGGIGVASLSGNKLPEAETQTEFISPITGEVFDEPLPGRPLQLSIDNVRDAIPQSNLSHADIIYEFPVEGLQTRLQAIFHTDIPGFFGPCRSVRPYFVDLAREYKAGYIAYGWSGAAKKYLMKGYVPWINGMFHTDDFYRVDDKAGPHDAYIKWENIKKNFIDEENWWDPPQKIRSFKFLSGAQVNEGEAIKEVSFDYPYSKCEFTYNEENGKYKRTISGEDYIDKETGKAIQVDNVLVQKVSSKVLDQKGRLEIDMCKGGEALLFNGGVVVKGTWSRKDLDSRTIFKDENGEEFKLMPGKTWVEVTDQNCTITYGDHTEKSEADDEEEDSDSDGEGTGDGE